MNTTYLHPYERPDFVPAVWREEGHSCGRGSQGRSNLFGSMDYYMDGYSLHQVAFRVMSTRPFEAALLPGVLAPDTKVPIHISFGEHYDGIEHIIHGSAIQKKIKCELPRFDELVFIYSPLEAIPVTGRTLSIRIGSEKDCAFLIAGDDQGYDHVTEFLPRGTTLTPQARVDPPSGQFTTLSATSQRGNIATITVWLKKN